MKWVLILWILFIEATFAQKHAAFMSTSGNEEDITVSIETPYEEIPFQLRNGMILVSASINHQSGYFILDTGAPTLVVNASRYPKVHRVRPAAGCSGDFMVGESTIRHFSWAGLEKYELKVLTTDLSHLEIATGRKILGLIGFSLLKDQELFIDYESKRIILFSADSNPLHRALTPSYSSSLSLHGHLPVIEFSIDGRPFFFGLDTGSETNLIDRCKLSLLNKVLIDTIGEEEIQGLDMKISTAPVVQVRKSFWNGTNQDQLRYLAIDLCHLKQADQPDTLDGLLGNNFLRPLKISINYQDKKFYIWDKTIQL